MSGAVRALMTVLTLPPTLAHEATHYLLAAPWAASVRLQGLFDAQPYCEVGEWDSQAPDWGIILAAYGPLVVGLVLALSGLLWAAVAGKAQLPTTLRRWLLVGIAAMWWGIYVYPSPGDRQVAAEVGE